MNDGFSQYYDEAVEPGKRERAYAWATAGKHRSDVGVNVGVKPGTKAVEQTKPSLSEIFAKCDALSESEKDFLKDRPCNEPRSWSCSRELDRGCALEFTHFLGTKVDFVPINKG